MILLDLSTLSALLCFGPSFTNAQSAPGQKPILGYNSYNDVGCSPNSTWTRQTIGAMASTGLLKAGYQYYQVDCGWQGYDRQANGSINYDASVFPDGIKPLSDYARSLGFKWSMYTDQGKFSCDTKYDKLRPGSLGFEKQDAAMFRAWNTEYVKVDNCFIEGSAQNAPKNARSDFPTRYRAMWNALRAVNINHMLICQWGVPYQNTSTNLLQGPTAWAPAISTSYRISDDIARGWNNVLRIYNQAIYVILNNQAGPGRIFDMDLLEVGNLRMTVDEQKTHFAVWATFKSSLLVSTNVPNISQQTLSILSNQDLIDINQDSLGAPVKLIQRFSNDYDLFSGPLANGDQVVVLVDHSNTQRNRTISFSDLGISTADIKNVWTGQTYQAQSSLGQIVPAHGSIVLRLSNIKTTSVSAPQYKYYAASTSTLSGPSLTACRTCATGQKVGNIVNGNSFTIEGIRTSKTTSDILFDYINADISYLGSGSTNARSATIKVNGGNDVTVLFPITGYDWSGDVGRQFKVRVSGFNTDADNTIQVVAGSSYAPEFDRVGVVV